MTNDQLAALRKEAWAELLGDKAEWQMFKDARPHFDVGFDACAAKMLPEIDSQAQRITELAEFHGRELARTTTADHKLIAALESRIAALTKPITQTEWNEAWVINAWRPV